MRTPAILAAALSATVLVTTGCATEPVAQRKEVSFDAAAANPLIPSHYAAADSLLGNRLVEVSKRQCQVWPHGTRPPDFNEPVTGATPILVLEGELDPVTPPRYGEQVLKTLANAKLIVARGQGHNIIGRGCLPKLVGNFMDTLDAKTLDAGCVDELGPIPHFIDFNGAAP